MKQSRFTETQIVSILKEVDAGMKVEEICRKHGISNATYYNRSEEHTSELQSRSDLVCRLLLEKKKKKIKKKIAHEQTN